MIFIEDEVDFEDISKTLLDVERVHNEDSLTWGKDLDILWRTLNSVYKYVITVIEVECFTGLVGTFQLTTRCL